MPTTCAHQRSQP